MAKGRDLSEHFTHTHTHPFSLSPKGNDYISQLLSKCDFLIVPKLPAFTFRKYFLKMNLLIFSVAYTDAWVLQILEF